MALLSVPELNRRREVKLKAAKDAQEASRETYKGYTLQKAIGSTGGAKNIGWEVSREGEPDRYLGSLMLAKHWVDGR